jgi:hypothetical protein
MLHVTLRAATPGAALAVTFEQAAARLAALPRMYFEPDGSFLWVSAPGEPAWQLEGQLQDRGDQLDHVEIKGMCSRARFDDFLAALGWPQNALAFHLVVEGIELHEFEFRERLL